MFNWIKRIFSGIFRTFKTAAKLIINYGKEVIVNAPAVTIMVTSAIGLSTIAMNMNAHVAITAAYLNPIMTVYFLSTMTVVMMATLAGKINA